MYKAERNQLIQEIERIFEHVSYPGDNHITTPYHSGIRCSECAEIAERFKGQDWHSLSPEFLDRHYDNIFLMTAAAFHYYLPAYLRAALRLPDSQVQQATLSALCTSKKPKQKLYFEERINTLTGAQLAVVKKFVELCHKTEPDTITKQAMRYWSQK
jgi:hypothetical protein